MMVSQKLQNEKNDLANMYKRQSMMSDDMGTIIDMKKLLSEVMLF